MPDLSEILTGAPSAGEDYRGLVRQAAKKYGIPEDMADRWVQQESGYNPRAISKKKAKGLTQLMDETAAELGVKDPYDPASNVDAGARHLSSLYAKYNDWPTAFAAYNAGAGAVDKAGGIPDYPETQAYVKAIVGDGGGSDLAAVLTGAPAPEAKPKVQAPVDAETEYAQMFGDPSKYNDAGTARMAARTPTVRLEDLPADQQKTFHEFYKGGFLDFAAPYGSPKNPRWVTPENPAINTPPGEFYVEAGKLKKAPGGPEAPGNAVEGLARGAGDVALTLGQMMPGASESTLVNRGNIAQMVYDAEHGGETGMGLMRFLGQAATGAPLMAAVEGAAIPAMMQSGAGRFLAGQAGKTMAPGIAQAFTRGASMSARGALEGGAGAGMISSASDEPVMQQIGEGMAAGGIAGPFLPAAAAVGRGAGRMIRGAVEPLTESGRNKIVSRYLGEVSGGEPISPDFAEYVPGSRPTFGEASGNAGIATAERNVRTSPTFEQKFNQRMDENAKARLDHFNALRGDAETLADLETTREASTASLRDAAFQNAQPTDPTNVVERIDAILKGPAGQRDAVVKALGAVRAKIAAEGGLQTDVEQLYGIRQDIGDMLSPLTSSDRKGAQLAAKELLAVKTEIDKAIEKGAPGFKEYLKTYSEMSRPIDEQRFLQSLNLTNTKNEITLASVSNAIRRIEKLKAQGGVNEAKSIAPETMAGLKALQKDLRRAANIDLGKARGSDTAQNLATREFASGMGIPEAIGMGGFLAHPAVGAAITGGKMVLGSKNAKAREQLAQRLLNPEGFAPVTQVKQRQPLLPGIPLGQVALPVVMGMLANSRIGQ